MLLRLQSLNRFFCGCLCLQHYGIKKWQTWLNQCCQPSFVTASTYIAKAMLVLSPHFAPYSHCVFPLSRSDMRPSARWA